MSVGLGGGRKEVEGLGGELKRPTLAELWEETKVGWTEERSEQLFAGILDRLESRRRQRRLVWVAITCAGLAVTVMIGLGLVGVGLNGPLAHLWSHVHSG